MKAVIADGAGGVTIAEPFTPKMVRDTDAIVRVTAAAICGTDLGLLRAGELPRGTILGHEFVGIIESVGSAVHRIKPGDRVAACDYTACGLCWWCRQGDNWHCEHRQFFGTAEAFGPSLAGAQAEFVRVPFADVVLDPVPDSIADADAVFLGDLIPTGWAALDRARLQPGQTVAILGGGPVGQVASLIAQVRGAGSIVVSEPDPSRRTIAASHGAFVAAPTQAGALVSELSSGRGADVVLDCVGGPNGLDTALDLVRPGGRISSVGVPHVDVWQAPVREAFRREVNISFVVGNAIRDRDAFTPLVSAGLLTPSTLISSTASIESAADAYRRATDMVDLKVLIEM